MSEVSWGRRASLYLLKDLNCACASQEVFQDMTGRRDDELLRAVTGLEGGLVATGETCGVLSGGALGMALLHEEALIREGPAAQLKVLRAVRDYVDWFAGSFGTTRCRERCGVDFYTSGGQVRFFLPGDRVGRCLWHISRAAREFSRHMKAELPREVGARPGGKPEHCALSVLRAVRERTGVGNERLERLSFVFDGGLGLSGGVCGALAGAVMAVGCVFGMDVRHQGYARTLRIFLDGHLNLLGKKPRRMPEAFGIGRGMVEDFRARSGGTIRCHDITGEDFAGWIDFQRHMRESRTCAGLMDHAAELAVGALERWHPGRQEFGKQELCAE